MALTIEQLEKIRARLSHVTRDYWEEEAIRRGKSWNLTQRPSKTCLCEQRRARKAAKNLVMYKTVGRRPWGSFKEWLTLTHPDGISANDDYRVTRIHSIRMQDFREPSGFVSMSRVADKLKDNH